MLVSSEAERQKEKQREEESERVGAAWPFLPPPSEHIRCLIKPKADNTLTKRHAERLVSTDSRGRCRKEQQMGLWRKSRATGGSRGKRRGRPREERAAVCGVFLFFCWTRTRLVRLD